MMPVFVIHTGPKLPRDRLRERIGRKGVAVRVLCDDFERVRLSDSPKAAQSVRVHCRRKGDGAPGGEDDIKQAIRGSNSRNAQVDIVHNIDVHGVCLAFVEDDKRFVIHKVYAGVARFDVRLKPSVLVHSWCDEHLERLESVRHLLNVVALTVNKLNVDHLLLARVRGVGSDSERKAERSVCTSRCRKNRVWARLPFGHKLESDRVTAQRHNHLIVDAFAACFQGELG
mmetsp:Transcript_516/g.1811  ORF Transcript_516/g.1811 Transcript_516/m.1811 type:complete len:228 (-) Transcript_516:14223-14906(-)